MSENPETNVNAESTGISPQTKRKILISVIAAVVLLIVWVLIFTAGGSRNLTGTWTCTGGTGDYTHYVLDTVYTFDESDHSYVMKESWGYTSRGTYELKGNKLVFFQSNGAESDWIVEWKGDELHEKHEGLDGYRIWKKQ